MILNCYRLIDGSFYAFKMTGNGTAVFFPIFIPACGQGIITAMTGPGFTLNVPENFRRT